MSSFKPDHYPQLVPYLTVKDAKNAIHFYQKGLGFTEHEPPLIENDIIMHAALRRDNCVIMLSPEGAYGSTKLAPASKNETSTIGLYLYVDDVDKVFADAKSTGAEVINNPQDMFWGDRMGTLIDPNGYEWSIASYKA